MAEGDLRNGQGGVAEDVGAELERVAAAEEEARSKTRAEAEEKAKKEKEAEQEEEDAIEEPDEYERMVLGLGLDLSRLDLRA